MHHFDVTGHNCEDLNNIVLFRFKHKVKHQKKCVNQIVMYEGASIHGYVEFVEE